MRKILIISILLFVLASCSDKNEENIDEIINPVNNEIVERNKVTEKLDIFISIQEVKKHNKILDCYTILDGKVYDVTSFFGKHPGGDDNLSKTCGLDATELFKGQHGNNAKAQIKKDEFYIGELEK